MLTALFLSIVIGGAVSQHPAFCALDGRGFDDHDLYFTRAHEDLREVFASENSLLRRARAVYFFRDGHPPLVNAVLAAVAAAGHASFFSFQVVNALFFALLIAGAYTLATVHSGSRAGLVAAFVAATLPILDNFSRKFFFHFHAGAILVWAIAMSVQLTRRSLPWHPAPAFGLGLLAGLAVAAHPLALVLSLPMLAFPAVAAVARRRDRSAWLLALVCGGLGILLPPGGWAALNAPAYLTGTAHYWTVPWMGGGTITKWAPRAAWWLRRVVWDYPGPHYLLLCLVGLAAAAQSARPRLKRLESLFPMAMLVFFLIVSLFLFLNKGFSHDVLITFFPVATALAVGEVHRFLKSRSWSDASRRTVGWTLVIPLLVAGVSEKTAAPSGPCVREGIGVFDSYTLCQYDRRTLWGERDLFRQLIEHLPEAGHGGRVRFAASAVAVTGSEAGRVDAAEMDCRSFVVTYLNATAAMYGLEVDGQEGTLYELLYYVLPVRAFGDETYVDPPALRRVIQRTILEDRSMWMRFGIAWSRDPYCWNGLVLAILRRPQPEPDRAADPVD